MLQSSERNHGDNVRGYEVHRFCHRRPPTCDRKLPGRHVRTLKHFGDTRQEGDSHADQYSHPEESEQEVRSGEAVVLNIVCCNYCSLLYMYVPCSTV